MNLPSEQKQSSKILCACKNCKKEFYLNQWEINRGRGKFCTHKCYCHYKTTPEFAQQSIKIKLGCKFCEKEFYVVPSQLKKAEVRFCSKNCESNYRKLPEVMEKRFWPNVEKTANCWVYKNAIGRKSGYGRISYGDSEIPAHRFSYELHFGKIPDDLLVCHKCDNRACVNPKHLFLGSHAENSKDMREKERQCRGSRVSISKLTEIQVKQIKIMLKQGFLCEFIANKFNVSVTTIYPIKLGKTWKHINAEY